MFNEDQISYMESLSRMDLDARCWCGWYARGKCENGCDPAVSCADKVAAQCPHCLNAPREPGGELRHIINCPARPNTGIKPRDLHWPVGTNLLTADQARAMFEHVLAGAIAPPDRYETEEEGDAFTHGYFEGHDEATRAP